MELRRYGSLLRRLTRDDIELVRQWRNDPKISQHMAFRGHITPEMQEKWFASVDNDENYFFIIYSADEEKIGMLEVKRINRARGEGEVGMFIFRDDKATPLTAHQAYFSLLDFAFDTLQLVRLKAGILPGNPRAQRFTVSCGFKPDPVQSDPERQIWVLTRDAYTEATRGLKTMLSR